MNSYLDTSYLKKSLGKKTIHGAIAIGIVRVGTFVLSLGSTAILARILSPADFGIVALVGAFLGFFYVFSDFGLSLATVQNNHVTQEQASSIFWMNFGIGLVVALVIVLLSPLLGYFYNDDRLQPIAAVLSLSAVSTGLSLQHQALARRKMKFWIVQASGFFGSIIGIIIAIFMAKSGANYWSLVGQRVVTSVMSAAILFIAVPWKPSFPRIKKDVREMIMFGLNILGSRVLKRIPDQFDKILIGSVSGEASLGLYNKAKSLLYLPVLQINYPAVSVFFPALSRMQDEPIKYRKHYYTAVKFLASLSIPLITCTAIVADRLVPIVLGNGWDETILFFRALSPAAVILSLDVAQAWAILPLGMANVRFRCTVTDSILILISYLIGIRWGAFGVAVSYSMVSVIKFIPINAYAFKNSYVSLRHLFELSLLQPILFSILAGCGTFLYKDNLFFESNIISLFVELFVFFCLYLGFPFLTSWGRSLFDPMKEAYRIIRKRKNGLESSPPVERVTD